MPDLPLDRLRPHPRNANRMPEALLDKLITNLHHTGRCPALIVRPHPHEGGAYEILDGHHRAEALRRLGRDDAPCEVWDVDDADAAALLLTLNRLRGSDDPRARASLVADLAQRTRHDLDALARRLPEDAKRLDALLRAAHPPPPPAPPPPVDDAPLAVTFFLRRAQRTRLLARLREIHPDRSTALAALLGLNDARVQTADEHG